MHRNSLGKTAGEDKPRWPHDLIYLRRWPSTMTTRSCGSTHAYAARQLWGHVERDNRGQHSIRPISERDGLWHVPDTRILFAGQITGLQLSDVPARATGPQHDRSPLSLNPQFTKARPMNSATSSARVTPTAGSAPITPTSGRLPMDLVLRGSGASNTLPSDLRTTLQASGGEDPSLWGMFWGLHLGPCGLGCVHPTANLHR